MKKAKRIKELEAQVADMRGIIFDIFHEGHGLTIPTAIIIRMIQVLDKTKVQ